MAKIEIVAYGTDEVVKTIDCPGKSERQVDKIDRGVNINLDHERFYTRIVEKQQP